MRLVQRPGGQAEAGRRSPSDDGLWANWERELNEATEVREYVDSLAAMRAASRLDRHDLHRIRRAVGALARAVEGGQPSEILRCDRLIHTLIYTAAGGDFLERTIEPVNDVVTLLSEQTLAVRERARCVLDEHRNLVLALESRDVVGAEHWSVEHMKSARQATLNISWTWGRVDASPLRAWARQGHAADGPSVRVD